MAWVCVSSLGGLTKQDPELIFLWRLRWERHAGEEVAEIAARAAESMAADNFFGPI